MVLGYDPYSLHSGYSVSQREPWEVELVATGVAGPLSSGSYREWPSLEVRLSWPDSSLE